MDPKQTNQLDPKLKEAYERVMGGTTTAVPPVTPPIQSPVMPPVLPQSVINQQAIKPPIANTPLSMPHAIPPQQPHLGPPVTGVTPPPLTMPVQGQGTVTHVQPLIQPVMPHQNPLPTPQMNALHTTMPVHTTTNSIPAAQAPATAHGFVAPKKKTTISPVIFIVGGIVFLLIYTVFWLKFFNVPLPFLSQ